MSAAMTKRERVLSAIRREEVDYVPCSPFLNPQEWVQRLGTGYSFPFGPSQEERVQYCVDELDLDMVVSVGWPAYFPSKEVSARTWLDGSILRKVWRTPSGDLEAAVRYDRRWHHGLDIPFFTDFAIGRFEKPWLQTEQDVACLSHILLPPRTKEHMAVIQFQWDRSRLLAEQYGLATLYSAGMGLTGAQQMADSEPICIMSVENPALLEAYVDLEHQLNLRQYEIALDLGVDIIRRNGFYESCDFYSPAFLSSTLGDTLRAETSLVHQAGRLIGYTMLTGYTPLVDHLGSIGIDSLVIPDPFFRRENPHSLVEGIGSSTSFWTGPSDTIHAPYDNQEAMRQAVRDTFEIFGRRGLLLTVVSSFKATHPWPNFLAMVDEWKSLR